MENKKELGEKISAYRILESKFDKLLKQREIIISELVEIQKTIECIEEVKDGEEILFPIGGDAYALGKLKKEKLIIDIGAGIALEKSIEEGKETLAKKAEELQKYLGDAENEIRKIASILSTLGSEIETLIGKSGEQETVEES